MARLLSVLLATLLSFSAGAAEVDYAAVVEAIGHKGEAAIANYQPENGIEAADTFSSLYFDEFEGSGMELAIGMKDPALKSELESLFAAVIGKASQGASQAEVAAAWAQLQGALHQVAQPQQPEKGGFWSLMLQAFLILVREGFEAILVVTALVAYLRKTGASDKLKVIYQGVGWALAASVATAWLLTSVVNLAGAGQEALEGITMLIAAAVLFYVSYWLFAKREAERWQHYVRGQIDRALSRGSLFTLGFAAFLAVFREGAETVLFYQALVGQANGQHLPIVFGLSGSVIALGAIFWVMRSASLRLPMGLFFAVTAALLYYMAISFTGNGVLELQGAGWISITPLSGVPRLQWIGLYPTMESVGAQLLLIIPGLLALGWLLVKKLEPKVEAHGK